MRTVLPPLSNHSVQKPTMLKFHSAIQTSSGCISCVKRYDARNISCWNVSTECV